jgi:RNA polymerase sigma-70 factor, ECF subfamily
MSCSWLDASLRGVVTASDTQQDGARMHPARLHPRAGAVRILPDMVTEADRPADAELSSLLAGCTRQDRDSFRRLYERTAPQLLACLVRILRNRALAEDALQDVFVQVWKRAGQFDGARGTAWSWLIAIARYRAIDLRRRESHSITGAWETIEEAVAEEESQDAAVTLGAQGSRMLSHCLSLLQPRQRECIVLAYQGGLTHVEVAGEIGEALGTVKSWIRRGLASLKRCLDS